MAYRNKSVLRSVYKGIHNKINPFDDYLNESFTINNKTFTYIYRSKFRDELWTLTKGANRTIIKYNEIKGNSFLIVDSGSTQYILFDRCEFFTDDELLDSEFVVITNGIVILELDEWLMRNWKHERIDKIIT